MDTSSSSADSSNESTDPQMLFTTSNKTQCVGVTVGVDGCGCECGCWWMRVCVGEGVDGWVGEDRMGVKRRPHMHPPIPTLTYHTHTQHPHPKNSLHFKENLLSYSTFSFSTISFRYFPLAPFYISTSCFSAFRFSIFSFLIIFSTFTFSMFSFSTFSSKIDKSLLRWYFPH
jgi:hypothetical protein